MSTMNFILLVGVMSSVFVSVIYGQYYPHRTPVQQKPYMYDSANEKANPFQKAYENEGNLFQLSFHYFFHFILFEILFK